MALIEFTSRGIYCPPAEVYIDPWHPVDRAIITHAHADHARPGHRFYLAHHLSAPIMRQRLGRHIRLQTLNYGERVTIRGVEFSLHPAGHIPGSAQIRVEQSGEVWVITGDFKLEESPLCATYEPVACHSMVMECTFGLPAYKWEPAERIMTSIDEWWQVNREAGKVSLLIGYALGKAQRLLQGVDPQIGPIYTHGAVENVNELLRPEGIALPATRRVQSGQSKKDWKGSLVVAPPSAIGTPWSRKLGTVSTGMASGWMALRGARRRRAADRGFVLSDHADWSGLQEAVRLSGAQHIYTTHGYNTLFSRWLEEQGLDSRPLDTLFEGETLEGETDY